MQQGPGQLESGAVAGQRQLRQVRPAGIRQAHQLGRLVERLARRIINAFAEQLVAADAIDAHQLRMAARHQQRDEGKFRRVGAQEGRQQMALQMMHAQHRLSECGRQRTGDASADQQRARQARPARVGHHVDIGQRTLRFLHHFPRQRQYAPDMVAAGQFGHDAAIGLVHGDLAMQGMRQQARHAVCAGIDQRHAGFVATRFNS